MAKVKALAGASSNGISRTWANSHGQYIAGRAYVDEADATAIEMEEKWGRGRLRLLVSPDLREKFDRQRYLLNQAIWHGELEDVRVQANRMVKAYLALDKAATEAGKEINTPTILETVLADGTVAAIVPNGSCSVKADGRKVVVYTVEEIGRLLDGYPGLAKIKQTFPGATVTAVRDKGDPLDAFHDSKPGLDQPIEEDLLDDIGI